MREVIAGVNGRGISLEFPAKGARAAIQDRGDLPQRVSLAFEHGEYIPFLYV